MKKKKILVLVDWFVPGYKAGGPIQSCANFAFAMKNDFELSILTTNTDHGDTVPYEGIPAGRWIHNIHPDFRVNYLPKSTLSTAMLKTEILEQDADFIYLNHLFSPMFVIYPLWLKFRNKIKGQIVLCPRGALYDSALSFKSWKKMPFLKIFRLFGMHKKILFHATNEREKEAIERFFPGSRILIADDLPNSNQLPYSSVLKQQGRVKCIFAARIVPIKNLLFLLQALQTVKAEVELSVIGPVEDKGYWETCLVEMEKLNTNSNTKIKVNYFGPKRHHELMTILRLHHLYVLPTTGENFGHSILEAFMAGRPVLISDQTPWLGLRSGKVGWDLPLADPAAFANVIEEVAAWDQDQFDQWGRLAWDHARQFIENPELQQQYLNLFA